MGSCCEPQSDDEKYHPVQKDDTATKFEPTNGDWAEQDRIALNPGSSFGQPVISGDDIIFISSSNNYITVILYNIKTQQYGECDEIKCPENMTFNIDECQYTFDSKNKFIYFINNNHDIMTLDLNTKTLILNQSITTNDNEYAHIEKVKNKIYILGATKDNDYDEKASNDNFVYCPYDAFKHRTNEEKEEYLLMEGFGSRAISIYVTINKENYILIMGGEKEQEVIDEETKQSFSVQAPCDLIWCLNLSLTDKPGDFSGKWTKRFLFKSMTSFGAINYKNQYIVTFGGFQYNSKANKFAVSDKIYALDLQDEQWYVLSMELPQKSGYFAVYQDGGKYVHLFAWNGKHYISEIERIIKPLEKGECGKINLWTEQGKNVLPTKSKSIRNMGPKIDD